MPKVRKQSRVSIRDIAKAAEVSLSTASCALRNRPNVHKKTQRHILQVARRMGYIPDANMASFMVAVRKSASKALLSIAWLNTHPEKDAWQRHKFFSPYLEGAKERALQLGYRIDEVWASQPGMTMPRIAQILYHRGIQGAIFTQHRAHYRVNWDRLAGVNLEGIYYAPSLHRIATDTVFNFLQAVKMLKRFGYRKLGVCLEEGLDRRSDHAISAMAQRMNVSGAKDQHVPPLFYKSIYRPEDPDMWANSRKQVQDWALRYRPDVIVGHSSWLVSCLEDVGFRVPQDIGVIHLAIDDDVIDWAGIHSHRKEVGSGAVELVISLMEARQFGVPKFARHSFIRGEWRPGRTLLIPKPA